MVLAAGRVASRSPTSSVASDRPPIWHDGAMQTGDDDQTPVMGSPIPANSSPPSPASDTDARRGDRICGRPRSAGGHRRTTDRRRPSRRCPTPQRSPTWYRSDHDRHRSVHRRANPWYRQLLRYLVALDRAGGSRCRAVLRRPSGPGLSRPRRAPERWSRCARDPVDELPGPVEFAGARGRRHAHDRHRLGSVRVHRPQRRAAGRDRGRRPEPVDPVRPHGRQRLGVVERRPGLLDQRQRPAPGGRLPVGRRHRRRDTSPTVCGADTST